jgi:hypothetical protein
MKLECRDKLREQETEEDGEQHQRCCNYTYGDLGERCFGRIGRHFTEATIILSQTGGTVAYLVFIGQNVSSVFAAEDGHGPLTPATVVLALLLPVQAALSLVRSLSSLGQFSILADACTVLAVATVVKQDLQLLAARGEQPFQGRAAVEGLWGVAFAAGFAVFCFEGFCMTLALEASMADRSRFRSVLLQAIAGVTAVYVCFGACGYLAYGDATKDIITLNLPSTWSTAAVKVSQETRTTRPAGRIAIGETKPEAKKRLLSMRAGCAVHRAGTDVPGDDAPDPRDRGGAAAGAGRVAAEARRRRGAGGPAREPRSGAGGAVGDRVLRAGVRVVRVLRGEHGVRAALLRAARAVPPPRRGPRRGRRAARRRLGHPPLRPRLRGADERARYITA